MRKITFSKDPDSIRAAEKLIRAGGPICPFMPEGQRAALADGLFGEEGDYFASMVHELAAKIESMPQTYDQDGMGDSAVAHLHYFRGGADFWITEKDMDGGVQQAFGLASVHGTVDDAEIGYISITELTNAGVELDLFWEPKTLADIKRGREVVGRPAPEDDGPCP